MKNHKITISFIVSIMIFWCYACSCDYVENNYIDVIFLDENSACYIAPENLDTSKNWWQLRQEFLTDTTGNFCNTFIQNFSSITPIGGNNDFILAENTQYISLTLNPNTTESTYTFNSLNGENDTLKMHYLVKEFYHSGCSDYHLEFSNITLENHTFKQAIYSETYNWVAVYYE